MRTEEERDRDLIACLAMQGMLAHSTRYKPPATFKGHWHSFLATEAYEIAEAMMKARLERIGVRDSRDNEV